MATFKHNNSNTARLDYLILQNGWISLYYNNKILENDLKWFAKEKYTVIEFNCSNWFLNEQLMHEQIKEKLNFPDYYGYNMAALNDSLSDIDIVNTGTVIVFKYFDKIGLTSAHELLDTFANIARLKILYGERLIILLKVDNPEYRIKDVGATSVLWNPEEWLDSSRI